jgi:hypothetical protein
MFPFVRTRRDPTHDQEIARESAAIAVRRSRPVQPMITPEESRAAERAFQRHAYDTALAAGEIDAAPSDFTGYRIGAITVLGPADEPGSWGVHNPTPPRGRPNHYTISTETLLACHAAGDLTAPSGRF